MAEPANTTDSYKTQWEEACRFVVNKADRPGANDARRDLELMLDLSHVSGQEDESGYRPPIVMASAIDGTGAADVWDAVTSHRTHLEETGKLQTRRERRLKMELLNRLEQLFRDKSTAILNSSFGQDLLDQVGQRSLAPTEAARRLANHAGIEQLTPKQTQG